MHALLLAVCCIVSGHVHTAAGTPLAGARVVLHGPTNLTLTSDVHGAVLTQAEPGDYQIDALAPGFGAVSVDVKVDHDVALDFELEPSDAPTLRTIGVVTVDGRLTPLRGVIPAVKVSRASMEQLGQTQVTQSLLAIP